MMLFLYYSMSLYHYMTTKKNHHLLNVPFILFLFPLMVFFYEGKSNIYGNSFFFMSNMLSFLTISMVLISIVLLGVHFKGRPFVITATFILLLSSLVIFTQEEFFLFFVAFEMSALPILLIILVGGKSPFRGEATLYLLCFTISSSLLFLFSLIFLLQKGDVSFSHGGAENYFFIYSSSLNASSNFMLSLFITLTFLVKFPVFFFHIWLPKAHVEAPTMGSMLLAAILLKLGGVGVFFFHKLFFSSLLFFESLSLFTLWGGFWMGIVCFKQEDSKILIAYSSINHMALVIFGLLTGTSISLHGATYIMVGHGFISSLLFFLNGSAYLNIANRSGSNMKQGSYLLFFIWIFACFVNGGFPPFINFLGEMMILSNALFFPSLIPLLFANFFIGILYSIALGSFFLKKNMSFLQKFTNSGLFFQLFISSLHIFPMFFLLNLELGFL